MDLVRLSRACNAVKIPSGERVELPKDTEVYVTQALGGAFTVQSRSFGGMYRIAGSDADAIGFEVKSKDGDAPDAGDIDGRVTAALKTCYDPEIPVNIVDLGLVYDTRIDRGDDGRYRVAIKMTLTAQGCGMGVAIAADAEDKLRSLEEVDDARVEIVEEGRRILGMS
jgi:probable FeS assembly SUF system protein SufT